MFTSSKRVALDSFNPQNATRSCCGRSSEPPPPPEVSPPSSVPSVLQMQASELHVSPAPLQPTPTSHCSKDWLMTPSPQRIVGPPSTNPAGIGRSVSSSYGRKVGTGFGYPPTSSCVVTRGCEASGLLFVRPATFRSRTLLIKRSSSRRVGSNGRAPTSASTTFSICSTGRMFSWLSGIHVNETGDWIFGLLLLSQLAAQSFPTVSNRLSSW